MIPLSTQADDVLKRFFSATSHGIERAHKDLRKTMAKAAPDPEAFYAGRYPN
jgi:hypothetical protein